MSAPFTVIIPSYRRTKSLYQVINDLSCQEMKPEKLIVIDASPSSMRIDISKVDIDFQFAYLVSDGKPNVSQQRNNALREVKSPWVLFLDDDVRLQPDLIRNYYELLETGKFDGINGLVKLPKHKNFYEVVSPKDRLHQCGGKNYQGSSKIVETHVICTANFLARTEVVLNVGGFDEQLTGTIDDVDLGIRMKLHGYKIIHHPLPELMHLQIKSSGARSFGNAWSLTNLFYFRYRHFDNPASKLLLIDSLFHQCRPSKSWLNPKLMILRVKEIINSHKAALRKIQEGPKYIN